MLCWSAWFCLTNPSTHPSIVDLLSVVTPQQQQLEQTSLSSSIFEHLPREESWWLLNQSLKVLGCSFNIMEQQFHSESHCMTKLLGLSLRETPATPRRKHISATCIHHLLSGGRIKEEVEPRMVPRLRTLLLAQPSVLHSSRVTVTLQLLKWFSGTSQAQFHLTEQDSKILEHLHLEQGLIPTWRGTCIGFLLRTRHQIERNWSSSLLFHWAVNTPVMSDYWSVDYNHWWLPHRLQRAEMRSSCHRPEPPLHHSCFFLSLP